METFLQKLNLKIGLIIFTALFGSNIHAQLTFQKTFGGTNNEVTSTVKQTTDGGYIISGSTSSFGAGNYDIYLIKTNAIGDSLWTKTFGGTGNDYAYSVQQTLDGGYIVTGSTASFGAGNVDVYLIKTNSSGTPLWTKTFGGIKGEAGMDVHQTSDGGYIISGYNESLTTVTDDEVYLIKTDANGDSLWTRTYGQSGLENGFSVRQTSGGGYVITGYSTSFAGSDFIMIKTDANGNLLFTKTFGGVNNDDAVAMEQTSDKGYIICGYTNTYGAGNYDVYLVKTDSIGVLLWSKTFGGANNDYGYSVQQTTDGGYIVTGNTATFLAGSSDIYLIKTDANGDSLWTRTIGGTDSDYSNSVQQTTDGGYVIVGYSKSFGAGLYDVYLIKTDANGRTGCHEGNSNTIVTSPLTSVTNHTMQILSGGIVGSPVMIKGGGGIVNSLCLTTDINEKNIPDNFANISPNPFSTQTTLRTDIMLNDATLSVNNCLGQTVKQIKNISGQTLTMFRDALPSGLYFFQLIQDNKIVKTGKLVITD